MSLVYYILIFYRSSNSSHHEESHSVHEQTLWALPSSCLHWVWNGSGWMVHNQVGYQEPRCCLVPCHQPHTMGEHPSQSQSEALQQLWSLQDVWSNSPWGSCCSRGSLKWKSHHDQDCISFKSMHVILIWLFICIKSIWVLEIIYIYKIYKLFMSIKNFYLMR